MSSSKVTQTLIAPSSSSEHDSGASSDAPIIMSFPIKDPPAQNCVFTFSHERITEASIPRISPLPCVYGPFRVWRVLSKGGFATAMGAEDITSNRLICLKAFRKDRLKLKHTEGVLFNELDVYKHLASSSPRPASMFLMGLEMAFQTTEAICFAMDLMACDLNTCMRARPEYCSKNARRWTVQVAHGINALHEMGIIHRDIKPGNILIDTRQNVRVTDFGLSYLHKGPLEPQGAYTVDVVGTKGYTAPEILYNKTSPGFMMYGAAVDWWALGCVVFELLSEGHQGLFDTEEDFWDFVCLRSTPGMTYSDFPAFKGLPYDAVSLIGGLLDPAPFRRYVFQQLADHPCFSDESGASVFVDPYSHALRRKEKPHILPDLRRGRETHTAQIWDPNASWEDPARVANVDWIKKPFVSVS